MARNGRFQAERTSKENIREILEKGRDEIGKSKKENAERGSGDLQMAPGLVLSWVWCLMCYVSLLLPRQGKGRAWKAASVEVISKGVEKLEAILRRQSRAPGRYTDEYLSSIMTGLNTLVPKAVLWAKSSKQAKPLWNDRCKRGRDKL